MNWGAVAAVAEVLGVLAIIISILFLVKEVKTGNDLNRTNTFREIMYGMATHMNVMFGPDNAELVLKGYENYASLQSAEKLRFDHLMANLFQYAEDSWNSAQVHLLRDESISGWAWYLRSQLFKYPGARQWWSEYKLGYAPEFQGWITSIIQSLEADDD